MLHYDAAAVATVLLIAPFVVIGVIVLGLAFSSGGRSRRRRSPGGSGVGGAGFKALLPLLFIGLGLAVPAAVIAARSSAIGGTGQLASVEPTPEQQEGKILFGSNCASCHSLAAANARGATGPVLDDLGQLTRERVLSAIKNGGSGDLRMPAGLLEGKDAENVAAYVSRVAGR